MASGLVPKTVNTFTANLFWSVNRRRTCKVGRLSTHQRNYYTRRLPGSRLVNGCLKLIGQVLFLTTRPARQRNTRPRQTTNRAPHNQPEYPARTVTFDRLFRRA